MAASRSVSVRVDAATYERARALAAQRGRSITRVIEDAVAEAARLAFWREVAEVAERLRAEPAAWAAYQAQSKELEGTLLDGMDLDEGVEWDESLTDAAAW